MNPYQHNTYTHIHTHTHILAYKNQQLDMLLQVRAWGPKSSALYSFIYIKLYYGWASSRYWHYLLWSWVLIQPCYFRSWRSAQTKLSALSWDQLQQSLRELMLSASHTAASSHTIAERESGNIKLVWKSVARKVFQDIKNQQGFLQIVHARDYLGFKWLWPRKFLCPVRSQWT